jgi:outer membrane immunogenic protein
MRALVLAVFAAVAPVAASAADLGVRPVKAPVAVIAPAYDWSGFYIGGHGGYAWGRSRTDALAPDALDCGGIGTCPERLSHNTDGAFGGLHAGYNWQFNTFLLGVEIEGGYLGAKGSASSAAVPDHFFSARYGAYGALTGRLGFAMDRTLFFVKGGGVVASIKNEALDDFPAPDPEHSISQTNTRWGWTVGGGIEYAFLPNWTARAEYAYMSFERKSAFDIGDGGGTSTPPSEYRFRSDLHTVRLGISYKFGGGPVVARY